MKSSLIKVVILDGFVKVFTLLFELFPLSLNTVTFVETGLEELFLELKLGLAAHLLVPVLIAPVGTAELLLELQLFIFDLEEVVALLD